MVILQMFQNWKNMLNLTLGKFYIFSQGWHYRGCLGVVSSMMLLNPPLEPKFLCTVSTLITSMTFLKLF